MVLCLSTTVQSQAPQAFNYQAVIRADNGNVLVNQTISLRVSILQGTETGTVVYIETHSTNTDDNGLIALRVGSGEPINGNFSVIDWGLDAYFVQIELDVEGGTDFVVMGTSQLNSVPYAMYAENVNRNNLIWSENDNSVYYNDGYIGIGTDTPGHHIEINANATGDDGINRQFISVRNLNNTFKSYSAVGLSSGTDTNKSDGALAVTAMNFTALPDLAGMTYVVNNENGVAIRARNANGTIKFWTGGDGSSFERMTISNDGNIGINNINPKSKLQVSDGDIYIDQIGSGVIMKSPDGNCWRMTVDNAGNPVFISISCP